MTRPMPRKAVAPSLPTITPTSISPSFMADGSQAGGPGCGRTIIVIGAPMHLAFWAPLDSPIKTTADLKGRRVPSGWAGLPIIHYTAGANLANGGLSWDDVVQVPVAEVHLSDIEGREEFRRHSVIADVVAVRVSGEGVEGYFKACDALAEMIGLGVTS